MRRIEVALPFGVTPEDKRGKYRAALLDAGLQPVEDLAALDRVRGLLLAGGTDVDPRLYGQAPRPETDRPDEDRDRLEIALIGEALERDLPVLGICRGLQILNVALGGTLAQHIDGHLCPKQRAVHEVAIRPDSLLQSTLGCERYVVNSFHHQCAGRVAERLRITATAPDGVVEAVELPGKRFALAVQWHPETRIDGDDRKLFAAFRAAME